MDFAVSKYIVSETIPGKNAICEFLSFSDVLKLLHLSSLLSHTLSQSSTSETLTVDKDTWGHSQRTYLVWPSLIFNKDLTMNQQLVSMGPDNRCRPSDLSLYQHVAEHTGTEVLFKIKLRVLPF